MVRFDGIQFPKRVIWFPLVKVPMLMYEGMVALAFGSFRNQFPKLVIWFPVGFILL